VLVLLSGLVGALIGAAVTASFHLWRLRREELNARCDELCKAVLDAGLIAADYWATDFTSKVRELRIAEAKILGAQSLIDGLYAEMRIRLRERDAEGMDHLMSELLDALTGGEFTVQSRQPDIPRVQRAAQSASSVIVALRRAYHNTMPFSDLAKIANENRHRRIDVPTGWSKG
jgi:hypothetical protein